MTHPAIEQAVKAFERIKARVCGHKTPYWKDDYYVTHSRGLIAEICDEALRAMQQEPVSKTDAELAREFAKELVWTLNGVDSKYHEVQIKEDVLKAFAAIRKQARGAVLEEAAMYLETNYSGTNKPSVFARELRKLKDSK